jgi:cell division protein FtsB
MHWLNRILLALMVAAAAAFGPAQLELAGGGHALERVEAEAAALRVANAELQDEIRLLQAEIHALAREPAEVARIARQDLNLVAPGEVVFDVERVRPAKPTEMPKR